MVKDVRKRIRLLEREIEKVKMMHSLGKLSTNDAKKMILQLDSYVMKNVNSLPEYERQFYLIKKEFGIIHN